MHVEELMSDAAVLTLIGVMAVGGLEWISSFFKRGKVEPDDPEADVEEEDELPRVPMEEREPDGIYQVHNFRGERRVGTVSEATIDAENEVVHFEEIYHSDELLIPEECEFQEYKLHIATVEDATKVDKFQEKKGRILYGVKAEIVGHLER